MIRIQNLNVFYGPIQALCDVSLEVERGECLLVTGPSGCGKSTLGRVLCGLIPQAIPARLEEGPLGEEEARRRLDAWWAARAG